MIRPPRTPRTVYRAVCAAVACVVTAAVVGAGASTPAYADAIRDEQYQLRALDAATAWRTSTGTGVTVAVLDSGVDAGHPDLAGQVLPGADFVDGSTDGRRDFVGHGTTVAALIAGRNDKDSGVAGIAPAAKILPVRVLDKDNKYDDATVVAKGLRWAVDHGATVVNLSLGGGMRSDALADALAYAAAHDVVVVACTGNVLPGSNTTEVWYPAREPGVLAVAGLADTPPTGAPATGGLATSGGSGGAADPLWVGSLTGVPTVLTAPAVNLIGARPGGYWRVQGTSFAAPLVAGTAALVRSRWPTLDADNVINRLIRTARDLGPPGRDDRYGYGEVNPVAALTAQVPVVRRNPLVPPRAQPSPSATRPADRAGPAFSHRIDQPWLTPRRVLVGFAVSLAVLVLMLSVALTVVLRVTRRAG